MTFVIENILHYAFAHILLINFWKSRLVLRHIVFKYFILCIYRRSFNKFLEIQACNKDILSINILYYAFTNIVLISFWESRLVIGVFVNKY